MWAAADERILSFHSDVVVMSDGWIEVTETIKVRAEGNRIRRGIYRDMPTEYSDKYKNKYVVKIEPQAVLRNDRVEAFHTVDTGDGIRTYFGQSNRFIEHGVHTYMYRYRASRMLGFFEEHDELYWNVTGFEWAFPIDKATASVSFEFDVGAEEITHEAYTGPFGASGRDYTSYVDSSGIAQFRSNSPLSRLNGMTIVVGWPKGHVVEPTTLQRAAWLLKDNLNLLIAVSGLVLLLVYYIPTWKKHGKDPDEGLIITRYVPPEGFSPASLRYIRHMYYDNKVMTAAVVNLAVKGYLKINNFDDEHSLSKTDPGPNPPALAAGEKELYDGLFKDGDTAILDNEYHELLGDARTAHKKSLQRDYKQKYFQTNGYLNVPGIAIVLLATAASLMAGVSPLVIATIVLMFGVMVFFAIVMKRPTMRGRELLDEIKGFEDYLDVAEKEELNLRNPPEKTPELFESYLPYALALGVDQRWAERFAAVLASISGPDGGSYQPGWYNGNWSTRNLSATTNQLSSGLNSALASSVTPPGSSSGGGGGGFSGGGGGGGGGGGW
jgi:uncharacterized membrane protein YgcG